MANLPIRTRVQSAIRILRGTDATSSQRSWLSYPTYPTSGAYLNGDYGSSAVTFTDSEDSYARAYIAVSAVRACVDTYAWAIGQIPRRVIFNSTYNRANDKDLANSEDVKVRHIWFAAERWHQRNLNIGLISAMLYNTMLTDTTYALKIRSQFNGSPRLQILNSQGMQVEDHTGEITQYRYNSQGKSLTYKPDEIAYNHGFNPFYDTRGASIVASIIQEINIDRNLDSYLQAFFKNDAMPGMIATPPDGTTLNEAQWDALKKILRTYNKGVANRRNALVLRDNFDFDVLPEPDIEKHTKVQEPISQQIFQAFGVPRVLVGDNSSTPYKDADNVLANFIKLRVKPLALDLQTYINDLCLPFLDQSDDTRFEFDFDAIATETEADAIKSTNANQNYSGGIWTLNEAREHTGKQTYKNGDQLASGVTVDELDTLPETIAPTQPTALPETTAPTPPVLAADRDTDKSLTLMMGFANDPNLLVLQRQLKEFCKEHTVKWNAADSYHTTLIHLPSVSDGQLAQIMGWMQSIELPDLSLKVGSLHRFESVGSYALHFRIRQNAALTEWQTNMGEWVEDQELALSPYSQSANYIPHITMGYAETKPPRWTFDSKLSIKPQTLQLSYNGVTVFERQWETDNQRSVQTDHETGFRAWELTDVDTLHSKQLAELEQWQKHNWTQSKRNGKHRAFEPEWLRGETADALRTALDGAADYDAAKVIFGDYRERFSQRDIQATRTQFEDAFERAIQAALDGNMNRRQWGIEMRRITTRGINAAYRDGLKAGGVDGEPNEAEQDSIAEFAADQRQYINNLAVKLFKDEVVSPEMAKQKPQMWWGNSIQPAYYSGFQSAARNQMMEFAGDDGDDSCKTCQRLSGQRHRMKDWTRKQLIPQQHGENYDCGGWECHHILVPMSGKARGVW